MHRVRYEEGMPIPPGGSIVERTRPGIWIPGLAVFGGAWVSTVVSGAFLQSVTPDPETYEVARRLYVPVVGPVWFAPHAHRQARPWLVLDTILQAGGLVMFVAGLVSKRRYLVYFAEGPSGRSLALSPAVSMGAAGVSLSF